MPQTPGITQVERLNIAVNVSGADAMTAAARQNFMQGASQIKLIQTGGVASLFDPWQMQGLNADEIAAAGLPTQSVIYPNLGLCVLIIST